MTAGKKPRYKCKNASGVHMNTTSKRNSVRLEVLCIWTPLAFLHLYHFFLHRYWGLLSLQCEATSRNVRNVPMCVRILIWKKLQTVFPVFRLGTSAGSQIVFPSFRNKCRNRKAPIRPVAKARNRRRKYLHISRLHFGVWIWTLSA